MQDEGFYKLIIILIVVAVSIIRKVMGKLSELPKSTGEDSSASEDLQARLERMLRGEADPVQPVPSPPPLEPLARPIDRTPAPAPKPAYIPVKSPAPPPLPPRPSGSPISAMPAMPPLSEPATAPAGYQSIAKFSPPTVTPRAARPRAAKAARQPGLPQTPAGPHAPSIRSRPRLNVRTMARVAVLSEVWRPPLALRDSPPWERG